MTFSTDSLRYIAGIVAVAALLAFVACEVWLIANVGLGDAILTPFIAFTVAMVAVTIITGVSSGDGKHEALYGIFAVIIFVIIYGLLFSRAWTKGTFGKSIDNMSMTGDIVSMVTHLKDHSLKTNKRCYIIESLGASLLNHQVPKDKQELALAELCRFMSDNDDEVAFAASRAVYDINKKYIIVPGEDRIKKLIENSSAINATMYKPKGNLLRLLNGHFKDEEHLIGERDRDWMFWGKSNREVDSIIRNANGVIWIEEKAEQVGVYNKKDDMTEIFGFKGPEIANAYQIRWVVNVFDLKTLTVTAQTSLLGNMPPKEKIINETAKRAPITGEPPQQQLERWLQELPIRDNK